MKIIATVKSAGKKKDYITEKSLELDTEPTTLRELISGVVGRNVHDFNEKEVDTPLVNYLTKTDIELQSATGKIGFAAHYNENKANVEDAIGVAIQAFEDGLYKVFFKEEAIEELDSPLNCQEGDMVTFIRLTMLAGRMY